MRLAEWRIGQGMTQAQLADRLGCEQSFISQIERATDPMIPRRRWMLAIYRLTWAAVTPNDFFDLPELEQLALPMDDQAAAPAPLLEVEARGGTPLFEVAA
jgi:transcriptional regulator with XRE-family HTH domain